jgi:hypothetical protein
VRRVVIALFVLGLCGPLVEVDAAEAQVWRVKKRNAKPGATKSKPKETRTARPTVRKKARPTKPRTQVKELVPREDEPDQREPDPADEPILIKVEELD